MPLTNKSLLDTTRRPRKGNRLYCMVWAEDDLFKVGLGSGKNRRDSSATATIRKYLGPKGRAPGPVREWRWAVPALDNKAWGDCQRLEMVFATALKRRLGASAAGAVGFEWFELKGLEFVSWEEELAAAAVDALRFSALEAGVEWKEYTAPPTRGPARIHGPSQRDAWRTMRNQNGECGLLGCGEALNGHAVEREGFLYCIGGHAALDSAQRAVDLA